MPKHSPIRLDDVLSEVVGQVELEGKLHDVLGLNGEDYHLLNSGAEANIEDHYRIVNRVVPTIDARRLNGKAVAMVLMIADGRIQEVASQFPNVERPTTSTAESSPA